MRVLSKRSYHGLGLALFLIGLSAQANGGALNVYEMANPADVGTAGAGLAAKAQDASTVFNNPAGMTRIKSPELFAGATFLYLYAPFDPDENTTVTGPNGGASMLFGAANSAYVHPVSDKLVLGISGQNFLGLTLNWGKNWVGRYQAKQEWLIAPQVQPTVAYKVNDWLSVGAGAGLTLGYLETEAMVPNPRIPLDGQYEYSDSDFAVQGNFGLMIEPNENTRIGIRYLTETKLKFEDELSLSDVSPLLKAGVKSEGPLEIGMYMPQSLNISGFYQINDTWAVLGSFAWEQWSRLGKLQVGFSETGSANIDLNANDVYHVGIGGQYRWNPKLLIDFGFSFDSKMFDVEDRPLVLPMADMYRVGTGFRYDMKENFTLGAGVDFLWEGDTPVAPSSSAAGNVSGEYSDVFFVFTSVYGVWRF